MELLRSAGSGEASVRGQNTQSSCEKSKIQNPKSKILFVSHLADLSGAAQSLLEMMDCVDRAECETEAICPPTGLFAEAARSRGIACHFLENPAVSFTESRNPLRWLSLLGKRLAYMNGIRRRVRAVRPDVVVINTAVNLYAGIAARLAGARVMYYVHEAFPPTWRNRAKIAMVNRCAHRIVAASLAGARLFDPRAPSKRVAVLHNAVALERFVFGPEQWREARKRLGLEESEIAVGAVGYIAPVKGLEYFLEAARMARARAAPCRFFLMGDSDPFHADYLRQLKEFVRANALEDRVRFLPFAKDVESYYAALDVLVLSSISESLPRVVIEAMAAGVAVVATDVGGVRECVEEGKSGIIVPPRDTARLAEAIGELANDPKRRSDLAAAGQAAARARFSMERFRAEVRELFRREST
ncbi:MAG: glycosyltransferase family 4 protein [Candidatus Sumerlaeota bacterium]|nr:glycosyltransferase family 4 protein [Candidatus Sumerlaeota bacterium]